MIAAAATDTGMLRERNEDRYWVDADRGVFLVVDGVGGHAAGETAAQNGRRGHSRLAGNRIRAGGAARSNRHRQR